MPGEKKHTMLAHVILSILPICIFLINAPARSRETVERNGKERKTISFFYDVIYHRGNNWVTQKNIGGETFEKL